jgi:hypothetical protein
MQQWGMYDVPLMFKREESVSRTEQFLSGVPITKKGGYVERMALTRQAHHDTINSKKGRISPMANQAYL